MKPPYETFKGPTCKGSFYLGSACGQCERCRWELRRELLFRTQEISARPQQRTSGKALVLRMSDSSSFTVFLRDPSVGGIAPSLPEGVEPVTASIGRSEAREIRDFLSRWLGDLPATTQPRTLEERVAALEALQGEGR